MKNAGSRKYPVLALRALVICDALLFAAGIFGPSMLVVPRYGEFTGVVTIFKPRFGETKEISIISGIIALFGSHAYFIGVVTFLFSIIFPLWKLGAIWAGIESGAAGAPLSKEIRFIERLGKFSMLDVYLLASILIAIKGLPGGSQVELQWGLVAFTLSILLSLKLIHILERTSEERSSADRKSELEPTA